MRKTLLASIVLSCLSAASWSAEADQAEAAADGAAKPFTSAKGREVLERLRADPGTFCLSLDYIGAAAKVPRRAFSLSGKPLPQPPFHSHVVIDGEQALKIIAYLESCGFFERAVEDFRADVVEGGFILRVGGTGGNVGEWVGGDLAAFRRMDALADVLKGGTAQAMKQGMDALRDERDALAAAERVKTLREKLDTFAIHLQCRGNERGQALYGLMLSVGPSEHYVPLPLQLYALVDRDAGRKLVDHLADSGVLSSVGPPDGKRPTRSYVIIVYGLDVAIEHDLGWDDTLLSHLNGIRASLAGDAAAKMDKLLVEVNGELAKEREAREKDQRAKEDAAKAAEKLREDGARLAAERLAKVRAAATGKDFLFQIDYASAFQPSRYHGMRLTTAPAKPGQAGVCHSIDKKQALRVIEQIEKDGFFDWDAKQLAVGRSQPCYVLTLVAGGVTIRQNIGWRQPMLKRLEDLRMILEGSAADGLEQILVVLRAEAPTWPPTAPRAELRAKEAAERADRLRNDLGNFHLFVQFYEGPTNALYQLLLSTRPTTQDPRLIRYFNAVVDRDAALKIIDHLQQSGALERRPVPPPSRPRPRPRPLRTTRVAPPQPSPSPSYGKLVVSGGGTTTEQNLGWGAVPLERLSWLRALLDGDAADKMHKLTAAVQAALAEEAEKAKAERARLAVERTGRARAGVRDFVLHLGSATGEKLTAQLTLSTYPFKALGSPLAPWVVIDEKQAARIIDHLAKEGFFERAEERLNVDPTKPSFVLTVSAGGIALREELGSDAPLLERLKSLLTVVDEDGAEELRKIMAGLER